MTTNPIDWEEAMNRTQEQAETAARLSERAVSGVARMLDIQHRHSHRLIDLAKAMEAIQQGQCCRGSSLSPVPLEKREDRTRRAAFLHRFFLIVAFVAGALFGVSIGNW